FETNQEISKKTKGKDGVYELSAPQGMKIYVLVEKNNYLDFVSSPILVIAGGAKVNAKMYSESSKQSIDFEGLFDYVGNQKYAVAVDETYRAVFNVLVPKKSEGNSVLLLSVGQGSDLDSSNWAIMGYSSTVELDVLGGQELETVSSLPSSGWKWASFTKPENSSGEAMVYQVEVWLTVNADAVEEDTAIFNFRGNINEKDISLREQEFLIVAEEEMCEENICFSVLFKDKETEEYFPSGAFSTTTTTDFIVEFSAYSSDGRYLEGYSLNVSPDTSGSVEFKEYDIGGITTSDSDSDSSTDSSDSISVEFEDHPSDLIKGEIELFSRIVSDGIGLEFEFLKDNAEDGDEEAFTVYFDSTGDKLFDVQIMPSTTLLEGSNQIKLIVTEAGTDTLVTDATVVLSNKTDYPLGQDVTYSRTGFGDEIGYGKDGEYIFPEPDEFFHLEEGKINARITAENFKPKNIDVNISKEFDSNLKLTDLEGNDSIFTVGLEESGETNAIFPQLKLENIGSKDINIVVVDIIPRNKSSDFHFEYFNDVLGREIENDATLDFKMKSWMTVETASDPNFEGYLFVAGIDTSNKLHITTLPFKVIAKGAGGCFNVFYGSSDQKPEFFFDKNNRKIELPIRIESDCSCDITSFSEENFTILSGDETEVNAFDLNVFLRHSDGGDLDNLFSKWSDGNLHDGDILLVGEISPDKEITSTLNASGSYVIEAHCSDETNIVEAS
ncbi:MAG: hypothetical protein KAS30_01900, partial [Candidatus Diapherotrites archaeon]|nr:hypothetical protein [Candidatus Diapherotrites archaeon]